MAYRDLNVLDAAEQAADRVIALIDRSGRRLLFVSQMRRAVESIGANIGEGIGRTSPRDKAAKFEVAQGEAEETIRHLNTNFRTRRITPSEYWPLHNLLTVIVKMLKSLMPR